MGLAALEGVGVVEQEDDGVWLCIEQCRHPGWLMGHHKFLQCLGNRSKLPDAFLDEGVHHLGGQLRNVLAATGDRDGHGQWLAMNNNPVARNQYRRSGGVDRHGLRWINHLCFPHHAHVFAPSPGPIEMTIGRSTDDSRVTARSLPRLGYWVGDRVP